MYKKILVPLDGSHIAECVMPHVKAIAKVANSEVELVNVVEPFEIPTRGEIAITENDLKQINADASREAYKYLNALTKRLKRAGIECTPVVITGKPAESLVDYADNNAIDLIIMATHGRSGITKWFWGSVAEKVLRAVNIPILLVKAGECGAGT